MQTLAAECDKGRGILDLTSWSAGDVDTARYQAPITTKIKHVGEKAFRMIDGGIQFYDALGRRIVGLSLDEDLAMSPGDELEETKWYGIASTERLRTASPKDIKGVVCLNAVLYEDGTKEEF